LELKLSADEFTTDDTLRMVRPKPKQLKLSTTPALENLSKKLLRSIDQLTLGSEADADISLVSYDPLDPASAAGNAVMFVNDGTQGGQYLSGGIIAEKHPLMDGLNWQSLLVRETISLEIRPSDQTLLYQDRRPLILLRDVPGVSGQPATRQLRFIEQIRERKIAPYQENLETSQPISLAIRETAPEEAVQLHEMNPQGQVQRTSPVDTKVPLTTPATPGYYRYQQGGQLLLETATHFADTREADFRACAEDNQLADAKATAIQAHSKGDPYWHLWLLALIGVLLISWYFTRERDREESPLLSTIPLP
jgi:hypothetical protein